ncbi:BTB/POZ domain-containing protein At3g19850 isoform X2 [Salvia hispanica]|uniref:BTB/POZ domain-containing protein At3g19850 isoform X2 n=1 Tax=Salvia hispanica TaxID=49212 RepID=UPI002008FA40|nr:BTB/POZ domain-containing protein At3g19850 isoform X2 [Salvia hispanica]
MSEMWHLQIHINGQHTFFLSETILSKYSGKLRKIVKQEKKTTQIRSSGIDIAEFPGGAAGFELVSRFCYNNGTLSINVSNVGLLHCCAVFLGMTEKQSPFNLLAQTDQFLEEIFHWSWNDVVSSLKSCDPFLDYAHSCGLVDKLMSSLLAKIAQNSHLNLLSVSSSSSSSSPDTARSSASPSSRKPYAWWFQDMATLSPKIIHSFLKALGLYGAENTNLVITRFLLQYLKTNGGGAIRPVPAEYGGLADTAVHGVVVIGRSAFSCRGLFWVLKLVSGLGISRERRAALERLIGGMLDQAKLDDLLVSGGGGGGGVYDVNLVVRLIRLFVYHYDDMSMERMVKLGFLIDMYLGEIGPDPALKLAKFLAVAESLPDCARDSFDHVYRAIDIYLQAHPSLSLEERSRLCRCLNYEKLSLEACKDLAKNPRIPPRIAIQALSCQRCNVPSENTAFVVEDHNFGRKDNQLVVYKNDETETECSSEDKEEMKTNLERMQWRVVELEKVCREMKGQMARMVKLAPQHNRPLPRLC